MQVTRREAINAIGGTFAGLAIGSVTGCLKKGRVGAVAMPEKDHDF